MVVSSVEGGDQNWRFLIFNLLMRRKANNSAGFYVSKASGLKDLTREELTEALQTDESLLPQIVRQGWPPTKFARLYICGPFQLMYYFD
jgi:hypothetical protein